MLALTVWAVFLLAVMLYGVVSHKTAVWLHEENLRCLRPSASREEPRYVRLWKALDR